MDVSPPTKPKRQLCKVACTSCQKRRIKCNGRRPTCASCQKRRVICTYDSEAGMTRFAALTHRNTELLAQKADYETVFTTIMTAPESEAINHLRRLRDHATVNEYAEMLRKGIPTTTRRCWTDIPEYMRDDTPFRVSRAAASVQALELPIGGTLAHIDPLVEADHRFTIQPPSTMIDPTPNPQSSLEFPNIYHPPLSL
ncbi:hypothetical protein E4T52_14736 [Aureobasidium sp. EXF-3400]|nr:hypothetical protein E4T51_15373 [Aureobasidium sp. EXF-12344]KAI4770241.1 hypothetical protein E4T52_14736 [Aureobasidium sp. EXF-3400]